MARKPGIAQDGRLAADKQEVFVMANESIVKVHWTDGPYHTFCEYGRFVTLLKAGRNALANLADNQDYDAEEAADLAATILAGDELLLYLNPPSPDDEIPF